MAYPHPAGRWNVKAIRNVVDGVLYRWIGTVSATTVLIGTEPSQFHHGPKRWWLGPNKNTAAPATPSGGGNGLFI